MSNKLKGQKDGTMKNFCGVIERPEKDLSQVDDKDVFYDRFGNAYSRDELDIWNKAR